MSQINRQNSTILQNVITKAKARLDRAIKSFSQRKLNPSDKKMTLDEALDFIINTKLSIGATLEEIKEDFEREKIIDEKMLEELENQKPNTEQVKNDIESLKQEYKNQIDFRQKLIAKVEKKIADAKANTKPAEIDVIYEHSKEVLARVQRKIIAIKDYCSETIELGKVDGVKANFVVRVDALKSSVKELNESKTKLEKYKNDYSSHPEWFNGIDLDALKIKISKQEMTDLLDPIFKKIYESKALLITETFKDKNDVLNGIANTLSETLTIYEDLVEDKALFNEVVSELNNKYKVSQQTDTHTNDGKSADTHTDDGKTTDTHTDDGKSADTHTDDGKSTDTHTDDGKTTDTHTDDGKSADTHTDDGKSTDTHTDDGKTADQNPPKTNEETEKLVNEYVANINLINANNRILEQLNLDQMALIVQLTNAREKSLLEQIKQLEEKANLIDKENFNLKRRNNEIVHEGVVKYGFVVDQTEKAKQVSIDPVKYNEVDKVDQFVDTFNDAIKVLYKKIIELDEQYQQTKDQKFVDEGDKLLDMVSMLKSMISRRIIAERQKDPTFDIIGYMKQHAISIEDVKKEMGLGTKTDTHTNDNQPTDTHTNDGGQPTNDGDQPTNDGDQPTQGNDQPTPSGKVVRFRLAIPEGKVQYVNRDKTVVLKDGDLTLGSGRIVTKDDLSKQLVLYFKRDLVNKLKGMNEKLNILIKRKGIEDKEVIPLEASEGKSKNIQRTIKDLDSIEDIRVVLGEDENSLYYQGIEEESKGRTK